MILPLVKYHNLDLICLSRSGIDPYANENNIRGFNDFFQTGQRKHQMEGY